METPYGNYLELMKARVVAATCAGRDPEPWLDKSRNFVREGQEEAVDGGFYSMCQIRQLHVLFDAPERIPAAALSALMRARGNFAAAFEQLKEARRVIDAELGTAAVSAACQPEAIATREYSKPEITNNGRPEGLAGKEE